MNRKLIRAALVILILAACTPGNNIVSNTSSLGNVTENPSATQTATPFQPEASISAAGPGSATELVTPVAAGKLVFLSPAAPPSMKKVVQDWGMSETDELNLSDAQITITESSENSQTFSAIYALVAPFPTITDSISFIDIQNAWAGIPSGPFAGIPLLMDETTFEAMRFLLGEPVQGAVKLVPLDSLLQTAWVERPSWAIVPFEQLSPRWKVLELDGQSPLRKEFDPSAYPLAVNFSCEGECGALPNSNRDPAKLTTLIMTGTTALVRATANKMEEKGLTYPAQDIGYILRSADILHITNEIAFADDCPPPDPNSLNLQFCSDPEYIALLEDIGTDVVELTGNHVNDWGSQWLAKTVELYQERGWGIFGGGTNLENASRPYKIENNGNRIAFIGCNMPGPVNAWATETTPGAMPCGDYAWMYAEISRLRNEGFLPMAAIQFNEYYQLRPSAIQVRDFGTMAEAGAAAVSGSQSHFPQGFAFSGDTYIHYGPGNLFFDQMDYPVEGTRRAAIDRYTIYDGRVLGVELITTMLEDWSRPRLMTAEERRLFLSDLFAASGW